MSMKNSSDTIGNRTRDLPACSAVPQTNRANTCPFDWVRCCIKFGHCPGVWQNYGFLISVGLEALLKAVSKPIRKEGALAADCHGLMSADNFEQWGKEWVMPNVATTSIIVTRSAMTSAQWRKTNWSISEGPECRAKNVREFIVRTDRHEQKVWHSDTLFAARGSHIVCLCHFDPVELACLKLRTT